VLSGWSVRLATGARDYSRISPGVLTPGPGPGEDGPMDERIELPTNVWLWTKEHYAEHDRRMAEELRKRGR
jgi:hypothetical protein